MAGTDAHRALQRTELHARLTTLSEELALQRDRLTSLIEACQRTRSRLTAPATNGGAPRLFTRDVVRLGGVEIHVVRQTIRHKGGVHRVTPTEWQLLTFLLAHPSVVHTRLELAAGAWGPGFAERNSEVEVYVSRLRRKLGPAGALLETVRGHGYRLLLEPRQEVIAATQPMTISAADGLTAAPAPSRA